MSSRARPASISHSRRRGSAVPALVALSFVFACRGEPSRKELEALRERTAREAPAQLAPIERASTAHTGPAVAAGSTGPARFAGPLLTGFDAARALELARFVDGFYREPGNDGFEAVLTRVETELRAAGFGASDASGAGLELEWLATEPRTAWTPLAAKLESLEGDTRATLLAFDSPADAARTMLPANAPACDVAGEACFALEEARAGSILVLERPIGGADLERAKASGVVAVLAAGLAPYNVDPQPSEPGGAGRERDAIQYSSTSHPAPLPLARISVNVLDALRAARTRDPHSRIAFQASVRFDERPLRTLVATIVGTARPDEAVVVAAHVQEPGACDNASGVAGITEGARVLAQALREHVVERPLRSVVLLFGQEHHQTRAWLELAKRRTLAGVAADMLGESRERTGAIALLERTPDPGAWRPLAPDEHTAWGSRDVARDELSPDGLSVIARCALADVGALSTTWETREHPYEGGSDHDELLRRGIPGVLFWHFPDFAYHTSLDRLDHVDPQELARSTAAALACALAAADARPGDLERYLACVRLELELRAGAALEARDEELAQAWRDWSRGARMWLRELCLPASEHATIPASRANHESAPSEAGARER